LAISVDQHLISPDQIEILPTFRFTSRKAALTDMFKLQIKPTFWKISTIYVGDCSATIITIKTYILTRRIRNTYYALVWPYQSQIARAVSVTKTAQTSLINL